MEAMREMLAAAAARKLPMVVANPDIVTVSGGDLVPMPGTLARWYAELGGTVLLMGKPAAVIYERVMEMTGVGPEQAIAVGDSMEHDIAGAAGAGCASVFVCGGIHAEELGMPALPAGEVGDGSGVAAPAPEAFNRLAAAHGAFPEYAVPVFRW